MPLVATASWFSKRQLLDLCQLVSFTDFAFTIHTGTYLFCQLAVQDTPTALGLVVLPSC